MITAPFEAITMKVPELQHLLDKAEATLRSALGERQADLMDDAFAEAPEIIGGIGASVERLENALDDLFILRTVYVFDGRNNEVRVPIGDVLNLLMETDFK